MTNDQNKDRFHIGYTTLVVLMQDPVIGDPIPIIVSDTIPLADVIHYHQGSRAYPMNTKRYKKNPAKEVECWLEYAAEDWANDIRRRTLCKACNYPILNDPIIPDTCDYCSLGG